MWRVMCEKPLQSSRPSKSARCIVAYRVTLCVLLCLSCNLRLGITAAEQPAADDADAANPWKTGASFQRALVDQVGGMWSQIELRSALSRLAQRQDVCIFLDRRIDPSRRVEFQSQEVPLRELLEQLTAAVDAEIAVISDVIYVAPRNKARRLAGAASERRREVANLPQPISQRLLRRRQWSWTTATEPRHLLDQLSKEAGVSFAGVAFMPHDLWPAVDLPPLTWADRLSILLAGFDLTFRCDPNGRTVQLVPLQEEPVYSRDYPHTLTTSRLQEVLQQFPGAEFQQHDDKVIFRGTESQHAKLEELLRRRVNRPNRRNQPAGKTAYTLKVQQQPVGAILRAIGQRSNLTIQLQGVSQQDLEQLVTFDVREVTLSELLNEVLSPVGLSFQLVDNDLIITMVRNDQRSP
jgi:hypothetical protein